MANTVTNVTTGKPKTTGAIWVAPVGSTLPTDATTALDAAFKCLGYASEDGVTNANSPDTDTVKAWGGDTVLTPVNGKDDTWSFTLIEALNADVLKFVYGSANVSGTLATGLTVSANSNDTDDVALVIEMVLRGGAVKRVVLPICHVTEVGEVSYTDADAVGYETTVTAQPDSAGNTHYEYILKT